MNFVSLTRLHENEEGSWSAAPWQGPRRGLVKRGCGRRQQGRATLTPTPALLAPGTASAGRRPSWPFPSHQVPRPGRLCHAAAASIASGVVPNHVSSAVASDTPHDAIL